MTWPLGFWSWVDLASIAFFALFLLDKARLMHRRSLYRDRLGWSLIATDATIGGAYLFAILVVLDPLRFFNSPEHKVVRVIGLSVITWTWIVMRRTKPARMDRAMSGANTAQERESK